MTTKLKPEADPFPIDVPSVWSAFVYALFAVPATGALLGAIAACAYWTFRLLTGV